MLPASLHRLHSASLTQPFVCHLFFYVAMLLPRKRGKPLRGPSTTQSNQETSVKALLISGTRSPSTAILDSLNYVWPKMTFTTTSFLVLVDDDGIAMPFCDV